jgi:DNA topoisomerase-3
MRLVVAEKPSVARDLGRVIGATAKGDACLEGAGLRVTWCIGHLAELEDPAHYQAAWKRWSFDTLPMIPEKFDLRVREGDIREHFAALKRMLRDRAVTEVINACDAGREGELIFRYVYELVGCTRPVRRLWTNSLTDEAIRGAWARLRDGREFDALADAARCRSEADWLVGLNATRALTCLARQGGGEQLLSVGRVQTPTLAMIVARDRAIAAFVPEPYWTVKARFEAEGIENGTWEATFFQRNPGRAERATVGDGRSDGGQAPERTGDRPAEEADAAPLAERISDRATADAVVAATLGQTGTVVEAERKRIREQPPLLYDLTALQRRANERYGISAPKTLQIAQALYEKHKLITYPRTDARHLTPDQVAELPKMLEGLAGLPTYRPFAEALLAQPIAPGRRVVDAAEVGDHHAILPTGRTPDPARLDPDERRVFDLVARRLMAALSGDAIFDATTLVVQVPAAGPLPAGVPALLYRARGRVCREQGWRAVDPPGKSREVDLPNVDRGDAARAVDARVLEEKTRPPRPYNDSTLLGAMETAGKTLDDEALKRAMRHAGLGTPATRAAILETLLGRRYVERQGRDLRATDRGGALIDAVPLDELKSAELTGRWEARLAAIAEGRDGRPAFMHDVGIHVREVVAAIASAAPPPAEVSAKEPTPPLGPCPACGTPVREGPMVYACETGRGCAFVVFKTMSQRKISTRMVRQLLKDGRSEAVKGFKSKAGKPFDAALEWREGKVQFAFLPRSAEEGRGMVGGGAERGGAVGGEGAAGRGGGAAGDATRPGRGRGAPHEAGDEWEKPPRGGRDDARRGAVEQVPPNPTVGGRGRAPIATAVPSPSPVGLACPSCGDGRTVRGRSAWGCSRWREGCGFLLPFIERGETLSDAEAHARIVHLSR